MMKMMKLVTRLMQVHATCELRWYFPEVEGMMHYSRDKYFP
jgi:hypothetical protein